MPAPTGQLKRTHQSYDAEVDFASSRVTLSATTATTGFAFDVISQGAYKVQVSADAYTGFVAGTAHWSVDVQVSGTLAGTYTTVVSSPIGATGSTTDVILSGREVQQTLATAAFIRLNVVKTGTPGNLSYEASICPVSFGG